MIKFKKKNFSIASDTVKGATLGATVGTIISGAAPASLPKFIPGSSKYNELSKTVTIETKKDGKVTDTKTTTVSSGLQKGILLGTATLIGAALGTLCGTVKAIDKKLSKNTVDNRLMSEIMKGLEKNSYKEGRDFTRDPKQANIMKTKVCLVITKNAGEFRLLVNVVDDPKLKTLSEKITKKLTGPFQIRNSSATNRYNEINISTIPNSSANIRTVVDIATSYINAGYPVYLVEVG